MGTIAILHTEGSGIKLGTVQLASLAEREGRDAKEALSMATVAVAAIRGLLLQEVLAPTVRSQDAVALILRMSDGGCARGASPAGLSE